MCTGEPEYLDSSIEQLELAKELSLNYKSAEKAGWIHNLAFTLATRFHGHGKIEDLERAVENSRQACKEEKGRQDYAMYLDTPSTNLRLLHEQTESLNLLEEALQRGREGERQGN
jgi:hypothetical protein